MRISALALIIYLITIPFLSFTQTSIQKSIELKWKNINKPNDTICISSIELTNGIPSERYLGLLKYQYSIPLETNQEIKYSISDIVKQQTILKKDSISLLLQFDTLFHHDIKYTYERGKKSAVISIETFANDINSNIFILKSFVLSTQKTEHNSNTNLKAGIHKSSSILASGDWYKIRINKSGIYKVNASDMAEMGFSSPKTSEIRLFGNGGSMLPEANSAFRYDDLAENAIQIYDLNKNNIFDNNDFFLFYGKGADSWNYSNTYKQFIHSKNIYDDHAYYFISVFGTGKRISTDTNSYGTPDVVVDKFTDFAFYENDSLNLIKTGREWYGELFDINTSYNFKFNFPNIIGSEKVFLRTEVIARSTQNSTMLFRVNGKEQTYLFPASSSHYLGTYAETVNDTFYFKTSNAEINTQLIYSKPNNSAKAWLNYIEINAVRSLTMHGNQMQFQCPDIAGTGNTAEYILENAGPTTQVWNITSHIEPFVMNSDFQNNRLSFKSNTDSLMYFVAHNGNYLAPTKIGNVKNQNLHALKDIDYVILYHPNFEEQAEKLADFHRRYSNLNVFSSHLTPVYNEFSSGTKDITAIRDFMKMLYDKADGDIKKMPKYLLLFGDASYDYKDRINENTNMIPTYESSKSLNPTTSYCTDDYYGLLDNNEGAGANGNLDIGIGRFPVTTKEHANAILNKIFNYTASNSDNSDNTSCSDGNNGIMTQGDWRNILCFIGDDEDGNLHMIQADYLANYVGQNYPDYNIDKIYFDAYNQVTTPGGQRYPEVKNAINQRIEKGTLVLNYTGHGGEEGWSHESVLEVKDILSWTNKNNLPLFLTATCEFSRYDDPERISAGEYVLLNPNGGGIGLLTTSRVTYSSTNFLLSKAVYQNLFEKENGEYPSMGDIIRISKNAAGSISANKNFVLLGDPALRIAYPYDDIVTTGIVDDETNLPIDTISALQKIRISGEIQHNRVINSDFNGILYPTIFDKVRTYTTLQNDEGTAAFNFKLQKNIIYKGKAKVENGKFDFTFIVPKDIAYNFGNGKISYYATNDTIDANGFTNSIKIGGSYEFAEEDFDGPEIALFINDTQFVDGGITDENPKLLAFVFDENGINTIGNGIGHDITAILDENSTEPIILNSYYQADLNDYKKGSIKYPFFNLDEGEHNLTLKVWDVYNNSSEAYLNFIVSSNQELVIKKLFNAPNPVYDNTSFVFEHNITCELLDAQILIYNSYGQLVRELQATVNSSGYRVGPMQLVWDGRGNGGEKLAKGVYIYMLRVKDQNGDYKEKTSKMVLMK